MKYCLLEVRWLPDPAAFDIARDDRPRDIRDFRDDRFQERERERPPREEERPIPDRSPSREQASQEAMEVIVNDDSIVLSEPMVRAINDPQIRMTRTGELARRLPQAERAVLVSMSTGQTRPRKRSRATKYQRAYKAAFRKCKPKHVKKDGTWKKGGFTRCVREAHSIAKKKA